MYAGCHPGCRWDMQSRQSETQQVQYTRTQHVHDSLEGNIVFERDLRYWQSLLE